MEKWKITFVFGKETSSSKKFHLLITFSSGVSLNNKFNLTKFTLHNVCKCFQILIVISLKYYIGISPIRQNCGLSGTLGRMPPLPTIPVRSLEQLALHNSLLGSFAQLSDGRPLRHSILTNQSKASTRFVWAEIWTNKSGPHLDLVCDSTWI